MAIALVSLTIGRDILVDGEPSLVSFALVHFAGYLFFFLLPVETLVPYYSSLEHNGLLLLGIALSTALVAQLVNYGAGHLASNTVINDLIGQKRFQKIKYYIDKYGSLAVFIFNLFPLASSVLSLTAGMVRFSFWRLILFSFLGLLIKYIVLVYFSGLIFS
jgi:membrane protein DedA with SNARE-associated domain